ncbi:roadblock/LC7 domain-containing protein [Dactylosporangium fulvum]|uniref:Roadblock/LC7 domain-containing protein n=1 Tax=Dactylosporangium fulvum TaxID=53359 RepID=A0ABY5WCX5_9ACTN|nr:roadblock/LC7 domain-containing protein [Dactylosporangium fulvum]UWP86939.1 roadblock/LC7 domain-containing protein [Dactylosporangium fulvum]
MINEFAADTPGVVHVVLLAVDGLALAASDGYDRDQVDKTAATAGSLMSIAHAISREYGAGRPEILTFRTPSLHFLFMHVADLAGLAVVADRTSNLSVVGHQMQRLVTAVGARLNPDARPTPVPRPAAPSTN